MTSLDLSQSLPCVSLFVIDYNLLIQKDVAEIKKLFKASTELGFFYLKVDDHLNPASMFNLAEKIFGLPLDAKIDYKMDGKNGVYYGYKAVGSMYTDRKGTPDTIEFWNISKDEILIQDETKFPRIILDAKDSLKDYIAKSHEIVLIILEILSGNLGLDSQVLPNLHRLRQPSGDQLRLTKSTTYPNRKHCSPNVSLGAHTDFGSITILFNHLYGLQVLGKNGEWLYVRPLQGHAIVNLGDAMVKLSSGRLKSNVHRVVDVPGVKPITDRYSVVYFARPEDNVKMMGLVNDKSEEQQSNQVLTAKEWVARRVKHFQTENYLNEGTYEMSRGTEEHREAKVVV